VEEELQRHESVLDHSFIAEAHDFIRSERVSRDMYRENARRWIRFDELFDEGGSLRDALTWTINATLRLYEAFEPYARHYLPDAAVVVSPHDAAYIELFRQDGA
jgi:hypothetical protein